MSTQQAFDYVVVGGGLAGLVVAARLAEDDATTVGVVEAGAEVAHRQEILTPAVCYQNVGNPELDWSFLTTPQPGVGDRPIFLSRGKAVGGTSILNYMQLARASSEEYDAFEKLGSSGWNWAELLQYFKKSETFSVTSDTNANFRMQVDTGVHGNAGPLQKTLPRWINELHFPFIETLVSLGVPINPDSHSGDNTGVCTQPLAIDPLSSTRSSSASAYYAPSKSKSNLTVIAGARATRIIFKSDNADLKVAEGVEYSKDGAIHVITAKKEVIVSAGSYQTPQLLELSGIGDEQFLNAHQIPLNIHLPGVGNNLPWTSLTAELDSKYESTDVLLDPARAKEQGQLYATKHEGMLSTTNSAFSYLPLKYFSENRSVLEAAEALDTLSSVSPAGKKTLHLEKEWLLNDKIPFLEIAQVPLFIPILDTLPEPGKSYFSLFISTLHPFSRGSVHIGSADPLANPVINPCFFENDVDIAIMIEAIKFSRKIIATEPLRSAITRVITPAPTVQTDEEILDFLKATLRCSFHPVGTASMLPREDHGVVDPQLKVYGTRNLRVVDASIIPIQLGTHTQASIYAIAEKAADIIKREKNANARF